jgi:hypothetical protein
MRLRDIEAEFASFLHVWNDHYGKVTRHESLPRKNCSKSNAVARAFVDAYKVTHHVGMPANQANAVSNHPALSITLRTLLRKYFSPILGINEITRPDVVFVENE